MRILSDKLGLIYVYILFRIITWIFITTFLFKNNVSKEKIFRILIQNPDKLRTYDRIMVLGVEYLRWVILTISKRYEKYDIILNLNQW